MGRNHNNKKKMEWVGIAKKKGGVGRNCKTKTKKWSASELQKKIWSGSELQNKKEIDGVVSNCKKRKEKKMEWVRIAKKT